MMSWHPKGKKRPFTMAPEASHTLCSSGSSSGCCRHASGLGETASRCEILASPARMISIGYEGQHPFDHGVIELRFRGTVPRKRKEERVDIDRQEDVSSREHATVCGIFPHRRPFRNPVWNAIVCAQPQHIVCAAGSSHRAVVLQELIVLRCMSSRVTGLEEGLLA